MRFGDNLLPKHNLAYFLQILGSISLVIKETKGNEIIHTHQMGKN